jgi:hypothetical protein
MGERRVKLRPKSPQDSNAVVGAPEPNVKIKLVSETFIYLQESLFSSMSTHVHPQDIIV